ncbi:hypothetical protein THRCLA_11128 [Thraustotheca clavata]|uniref:Uncharacterized protein n=1 Tax=Thraustotheca clavata TaxID=74557 RepID=A0A1V9Y8Y1_9STRA|nr:hypothetical protein THRCLA_11128 [Thraustotheca clavata]
MLTPYLADVHLDNIAFSDTQDYSKDNAVVYYSPLYTSMVHYNVTNDIAKAIHGLRTTDVQLEGKNDVNNTKAMELCIWKQLYVTQFGLNLSIAGGNSFDIAIGRDLKGSKWLATVKSNSNSEAKEIVHWLSYNITKYTVQWQNFKTIGLIDKFSIVNAFGFSYQISLQSSNGIFDIHQETSMKMYWTFARDLWAIKSNRFAYHNTTPLAIYLKNNTITSPLDLNLATFAEKIGPFGSIDLVHISPPNSLLSLTLQILESLSIVMTSNGTTSQHAFQSLPVFATMMPVPMALKQHFVSGGSFLCGQIPIPSPAMFGMLLFYSSDAACSVQVAELLFPQANQILFTAIAYEMTSEKIPIACSGEMSSPTACVNLFHNVVKFTSTYMPIAPYHTIIQESIQDVAMVELMQYVVNSTTNSRELFHQPLLDVNDPSMVLFGWMYLYEWAMGLREAVQINGDHTTISIISTISHVTRLSIDAMEVPRNLAVNCSALRKYISIVLGAVTLLTCLYSIINQFTTEGTNLFQTNRVGGLVWIGRPLLLVRSLTALAILSTATLELQVIGNVAGLSSIPFDKSTFVIFITKFLAAGEVTWLVYIIQDIAMIFTGKTTTSYGPISKSSVWFLSFFLSVTTLVTHQVTIDRQCSIDTIDYQIVCSTGTFAIGSITRLSVQIALAFGVSIVFYIYYHSRHTKSRSVGHSSSLLSCGAKYLFGRSQWVHNDLYYIDYASALLTGLITIPNHHKLYIFNIKLWRIVIIDRDEILHLNNVDHFHLKKALPLIL